MPRHTYRAPKGRFSIGVAIAGGVACTALLFLAIPLSQKLADFLQPEEDPVPEIEDLAPPPQVVLEETPPEEIEPEPEPEPLDEPSPNLDLDIPLQNLAGAAPSIVLEIGPEFGVAGGDDEAANAISQDPTPISKPQPAYPTSLKNKGIGGRVLIACKITSEGAVASASIRSSSGQSALDQAALKAARRWKFKPAIRAGRNAPGKVLIPFKFEVRGG